MAGCKASKEDTATKNLPHYNGVVPPVRDYLDSGHNSFGIRATQNTKTYGQLVHVGDDVSWYRDQRTVIAISSGIVRQVDCLNSWGHLVVIEHEVPYDSLVRKRVIDKATLGKFTNTIQQPTRDGPNNIRICSLYAHLGPLLTVKAGDEVNTGQKIGVIGRSYTWENGGYPAHLHIAIHLGPYRQTYRKGERVDIKYQEKRYRGRVTKSDWDHTEAIITRHNQDVHVIRSTNWASGYISRWAWRSKKHGWVNPRIFIAQNQSPAHTGK